MKLIQLRPTQRHILALNLVLVAGIIYFAARSFASVRQWRATALPKPPAAMPVRAADLTARPRSYYNAIVTRDIFNLVTQTTRSERVVKATDLHVKLLGTASPTASKPFAIIEDQGGNQLLYRVGDEVPDAGRLLAVQRDRVIVEHNGKRVALEMPANIASVRRLPRRGWPELRGRERRPRRGLWAGREPRRARTPPVRGMPPARPTPPGR